MDKVLRPTDLRSVALDNALFLSIVHGPAMTHAPIISVQITFHGLDRSEALEGRIHEQVGKLGRFYPGINSCRVMVEKRHQHHRQGQHFHVTVTVKIPGHELVSGRQSDADQAHTDAHVAMRDAFKAMRRQLDELAHQQQGHTRQHAQRPQGHVTEISADKTFGRIVSLDGRGLYFHRNSLIGADLDSLQEGSPVYFVEDMGEDGPQASSVYPVGKHHILV